MKRWIWLVWIGMVVLSFAGARSGFAARVVVIVGRTLSPYQEAVIPFVGKWISLHRLPRWRTGAARSGRSPACATCGTSTR